MEKMMQYSDKNNKKSTRKDEGHEANSAKTQRFFDGKC
jgi:hypothetical protein